jgi:hypothetical protein
MMIPYGSVLIKQRQTIALICQRLLLCTGQTTATIQELFSAAAISLLQVPNQCSMWRRKEDPDLVLVSGSTAHI